MFVQRLAFLKSKCHPDKIFDLFLIIQINTFGGKLKKHSVDTWFQKIHTLHNIPYRLRTVSLNAFSLSTHYSCIDCIRVPFTHSNASHNTIVKPLLSPSSRCISYIVLTQCPHLSRESTLKKCEKAEAEENERGGRWDFTATTFYIYPALENEEVMKSRRN